MATNPAFPPRSGSPPTLGRLDGLETGADGNELRKAMLSLSGRGYRAALFHLGALTRLNELGLLARVDVVGAVAGGSILAALLAARVPWPLAGAYRDWPETVAEPMRDIARRNARARALLRGPSGGALEERYARRLLQSLGGEAPERPRFIFGGAGLVLGEMGVGAGASGGIKWEIDRAACPSGYDAALVADTIAAVRTDLDAFGDAEQAVLENHGYLLADAAVRCGPNPAAGIEPLAPEPPHPHWMNEEKVRAALASSSRRTRMGRLRPRRADSGKRAPEPASPELTALLERHRPFLQYDSLESYRADSVATIVGLAVGRRCNTLHRRDGELIAAVSPSGDEAALTLDFLGGPTYANGETARPDDYLDECGGAHALDAASMRPRGLSDVAYGHARHDGSGRLWLQYWFFYYYNDKGLLGTGLHEGDWEMVQLRLDDDGEPDAVTYAQHGGGERADWAEVERQETGSGGGAAVVYPARGSHASRLRAGTHWAPAAPDHNDGLGPRVRPRLETIADDGPAWVLWPGRWGSTRRREAFESDSPRGPREHPCWWDPAAFHRRARPASKLPLGAVGTTGTAPSLPILTARRDDARALVAYRFVENPDMAQAARIVVAACGADKAEPPASQTFMVEGREGSFALQLPSAVRASATSAHGIPAATVTAVLESRERAG